MRRGTGGPSSTRSSPTTSRPCCRSNPRLSGGSDAPNYLHHERICFFHEVLAACRRHGVPLDDARVADVGSGTGYLLRVIAENARPASLCGFDTYAGITALARHLCPSASFRLEDFLAGTGTVGDVVFATEVLEHPFRPDEALHHLLPRTAPGGKVVLTVPDGRKDSFPALDPLPNGRGHWGHVHFWSPESWRLFLGRALGDRPFVVDRLPTGQNFAAIDA